MSDTVILCGMPEEKEVLTKALPGILILSGTDKLDLPKLVPPTCKRIVSAGLCGGLAPGLGIGAIVVASRLMDQAGKTDSPDPTWNTAIVAAAAVAGIGVSPVDYYSSGILDQADSAVQRAAMFAKYGTRAIDDESRYVAALAARLNIKFGVFRSVSDDWTETLPLAATGAIMNKNGSANVDYLLWALAQKPGQVPQLLKIASDFNKSLDTLGAAATACRSLFN